MSKECTICAFLRTPRNPRITFNGGYGTHILEASITYRVECEHPVGTTWRFDDLCAEHQKILDEEMARRERVARM